MNASTRAAPALPVRLFSRGSDGSNVAKKKPKRPTLDEIKARMREETIFVLSPVLSRLGKAMAEGPNPFGPLSSEEALSHLSLLWTAADEGDSEAAHALELFLALLSPPRPEGRPRLPPRVKIARAVATGLLESLAEMIMAGDVPTPLTAESLGYLGTPGASLVARALEDFRSLGTLPEEEKLLSLPPPSGTKAHEQAVDRAGRFLAAHFAAEEDLGALVFPGVRYVLARWWRRDSPKIAPKHRQRRRRASKP